jgi:hypothetical protein
MHREVGGLYAPEKTISLDHSSIASIDFAWDMPVVSGRKRDPRFDQGFAEACI